MKKIAVFNHKGGVAKTTTTFNMGFALAREGKKILLVDTDSQCNLKMCIRDRPIIIKNCGKPFILKAAVNLTTIIPEDEYILRKMVQHIFF